MDYLGTIIGTAAAICTTASYVPQVRKTWQTQETGDLSLKMLLLLATGLTLWVCYGLINGDVVIVLANVASLLLLSSLIYWKIRKG